MSKFARVASPFIVFSIIAVLLSTFSHLNVRKLQLFFKHLTIVTNAGDSLPVLLCSQAYSL